MSLFSFIGDAVDFVGDALFGADDLSGTLLTAGIQTAGEFLVGGPSGSGTSQKRQPVIQRHGGIDSRSVPRPSGPGPAGVADVEALHAEWIARMNKFAALASVTSTGGQRRK